MKTLKKGNECKRNDGIYDIKPKDSIHKGNNGVTENKEIVIFELFHDNDKERVLEIESEFAGKNVKFIKEMDYADINIAKQNSILRCCTYMLVMVSNEYLKDFYLMKILAKNYKKGGQNRKALPVIIEKSIYEPEQQAELEDFWEHRTEGYKEKFFTGNFGGKKAETIKEMQSITEMIGDFVEFSVRKDPKSNLKPFEKVIKRIEKNNKGIIEEKEGVRVENYFDKCQIIQAKGHAKVKAKQVNEQDSHSDLEEIIKAIKEELENMQSQEAESAKDALGLLQEEMEEEKPRKSRINKCFRLLSVAVQAIDHAPALLENIQKLKQYIEPYM